ncbi:MAG: GntR family transcriptional regulator [Janthinobacterium lividum]
MALELTIATGSSIPIYKQITDQVCMAIATGQLAPGDPLPSVRSVAERLVVNPNTVARAYADLARDGRVVTQPGRGLTVAPRRQMLSEDERERRLEAALEEFVREVVFLDFGREEIGRRLAEKLAEALPEKVNA